MKYIIIFLFIGMALSLNAQQTEETRVINNSADQQDSVETRELPKVKEKEKLKVVTKMEEYEEVQEALVVQQDEIKKISLALIVEKGTSKKRARKLGDHFLREAMSHFDGENKPRKKIGKSLYDYMISICTDRNVILMGTKIPDAETITW
ncbi:MAG: hypothetical protein ACLFM7_07530 [Bacteroidales bacterium]